MQTFHPLNISVEPIDPYSYGVFHSSRCTARSYIYYLYCMNVVMEQIASETKV